MRIGVQHILDRAMPIFARVRFGSLLSEMIEKHNALLVKLDADTGVASTDYAATLRIKTLAERE